MNARCHAPLAALCLAFATQTSHGQLLEDVFARVHKSVVTVRTEQQEWVNEPEAKLVSSTTVGSGVVIAADGRILTAAHVVGLADHIVVEFVDGTKLPARIVATDSEPDLALLKVEGALPPGSVVGTLGDSDEVRVGSRIFVVGAPFDLQHTLTVGYVSARRKEEGFLGSMRFIEHFQTDAAINRGNSGGPMFNMRGEIVGIVCHLISTTGASEGLGFVITANAVREHFLDRQHAWLGFDVLPLSSALSQALNVPGKRRGLLVQKVVRDSPADVLGLRGGTIPITVAGREVLLGGDIILEILGHSVDTPEGVNRAVAEISAREDGQELRIVVLRGGSQIEIQGG